FLRDLKITVYLHEFFKYLRREYKPFFMGCSTGIFRKRGSDLKIGCGFDKLLVSAYNSIC
ncbi:MAG: hypothetical protein KAX38_03940, partial [Candidatus Krumholzibacteria bacterium]|nr:hypothetical protein [Candidatus Krumholzibacteria bacterium]